MSLTIETIPAFQDNYIWLLCPQHSDETYVVDPGDAEPVINALKKRNRRLSGILVTHQHPDHIGGIAELLNQYPDLVIYGPADIDLVTHPVTESSSITVAETSFKVIHVPGHTLNHLAYYAASQSNNAPILFCGDTLFAGGCGRLFEGTPGQMLNSLEKLAMLPDDTLVYCAHEYTQANLQFAAAVEPDNKVLLKRIRETQQLRKKRQPTVPSTLLLEKQTNPFMRYSEESIKQANQAYLKKALGSPVEVFAATRSWKDSF